MAAPNVINEGDNVILVENEVKYTFLAVKAEGTVIVGKKKVTLKPILGCPFGSFFELRGKELVRLTKKPSFEVSDLLALNKADAEGETQDGEETNDKMEGHEEPVGGTGAACAVLPQNTETRDNRNIIDDNTAQKLSADELLQLKKEGLTGQEIISKLMTNNSSFEKKTEFSKAKYIKRKREKYVQIVQVQRPTARSLCEAYFIRSPAKIGCIRIDTLSQMLLQCDIRAGITVLVYDGVGGLILAAVAERLQGTGCIINVQDKEQGAMKMVNMLNLPPEKRKNLFHLTLDQLDTIKRGELLPSEKPDTPPADAMQVDAAAPAKPPRERALKDFSAARQAIHTAEAFISAPKSVEDIAVSFRRIYPLLAPSSPFVLYSQYSQGLAILQKEMLDNKACLNVRLAESWLREYQVLPHRTHPMMQMSGSSGYTLGGYKIKSNWLSPAEPPAAGPTPSDGTEEPEAKRAKVAESQATEVKVETQEMNVQ